MNLLTAITELISIFLFTTLFIFIARKAAKRVGLVDKPNYRKRHQGLIPLVGGISVFAGICFTFAIADYYIPHARLYLGCAGVLVLVGALDDRFDISVKIRAVIQAAIAVIMMMVGNSSMITADLSRFFLFISLTMRELYSPNAAPYMPCLSGLLPTTSTFGSSGLLMSSVKSSAVITQ